MANFQIAVTLKEVAKVGKVNCEKYSGLCGRLGIGGYPTIKLYRGSQSNDDYHEEELTSRKPANIISFVKEKVKDIPHSSKSEFKHDEL